MVKEELKLAYKDLLERRKRCIKSDGQKTRSKREHQTSLVSYGTAVSKITGERTRPE